MNEERLSMIAKFVLKPKAAVLLTIAVIALIGCEIGCTGLQKNVAQDLAPTVTVIAQTNGVGTNRSIGILFSQPMDPATINSSTFAIAGVSGKVTYDATNRIAAFKSLVDFAPKTTYHATVTTGAKNLHGIGLAATFAFSFTTRSTKDLSPPEIVSVIIGAGCTPTIKIKFDEQMDSLSINSSTVAVIDVTGTVTYDPVSQTATLSPTNLLPDTAYTLTVTPVVKDMGGVPLAAAFYQSFTTGACDTGGAAPIVLCPDIGNFSVLAGTQVTNTGSTVVNGDVGVYPGSVVTGFPPGVDDATHIADGPAAQAQSALTAAYIDAAGRSGAGTVAGDLTGQTLVAGVYKSTSSLGLTGDLTLDAQGNPNAVFIFQISSTLITGSGSHVVLINRASPCNIFWQVGSSATLGTNSVFEGNILALTSITVTTGAQLEGRALARNGAVTLDTNTIAGCTCP
jgi:hypothetical protein